ncbi:hypothetical protein ID866_7911 [Astraeus odoratus]|nr:hypothetical protein ID866_7911 [Astraeus odoratus]
MPAERSRKSTHGCPDGARLTWTVPSEPATHQSIAFAPNVTPVTFNDPPPTTDANESILFPTNTSDCSPRRPTHSKKRGEDHIPRPPNAFILFRSAFIKSQHVSSEVETNHSTLSKIIGLTWQNMSHDERQIWHAKAKKALEEHRKKWPQYAFRPSHSKAKGSTEKRKVREVEPKDLKRCAKIAQLLVEGKKGAELDAAIQEFDRTHVPEIVTRFEAPITAGSFRRSSSAPVDDDAPKKPCLSSPSSSSKRVRSTSSQPSFTSTEEAEPIDSCHAAHPLVSSQSCPDLSTPSYDPSSSSSSYSFPHKPQPSFDLDPFMFDMTFGNSIPSSSGDLASYPCSPIEEQPHTPSLCFSAGYTSNWTPASSPQSSLPATPQALSPSPAFDCGLEDAFSLNPYSALNNFAPDHHGVPPCEQQYSAGLDAYHHPIHAPIAFPQPDFVQFSKDQFSFDYPSKPELANVDMEFSTFMSSLTAF